MAVDDDAATARDQIEHLIADGFFDQLVRVLQRDVSGLSWQDVEDAVAEAVARVFETATRRPIRDVKGYLFTSARNEVRTRAARRRPTSELDDAENPRGHPGAEVEAEAVYKFLTGIVDAWNNANVRTVMLLVLEAAYHNEPLSGSEIAEMAGEILGHDLSVGSVYQWRARGLRKLAEELGALGEDTQL